MKRPKSIMRRHSNLLASLFLRTVVDPTAPFAFPAASATKPLLTTTSSSFANPSSSASCTSSLSSALFSKKQQHQEQQQQQQQQQQKHKQEDDWHDGEINVSLTSKLLYNYADPLLDIASQRRLESHDAFRLEEDSSMKTAVSRLENVYAKCRKMAAMSTKKQPSSQQTTKTKSSSSSTSSPSEAIILTKTLLQSQKRTLILTGILRLLNTLVQAFPALLISRLLRQIESGVTLPLDHALKSALSLVSVLSVKMVVENAYFHNVVKCACQVRGSLGGMIFDKSLRLSSSSSSSSAGSTTGSSADETNNDNKKSMKKATTTAVAADSAALGSGGVLNLMQSDATNIELLTLQLHTIWDGLLQISIYIALLYKYLGPSVLWGVGILLTTIPLNASMLRILNRLNVKEMEAKDDRMKKTTESIGNMSLLKLQSWEDIFAKNVQSFRNEELRRHAKRGAVRALNQAISNAVPTVTLVATLFAYARTGRPIVASTIFTAISLFNQLRFPLFFYPMLIDSLANGRNSMKRIANYLSREEIVSYVEYLPKLEGGGGSIELMNGNFMWSSSGSSSSSSTAAENDADGECNNRREQITKKGEVPALCDASISIGPGEVVAVVGEVGSGKSALVKALIGELVPTVSSGTTASGGDDVEEDQKALLQHQNGSTMHHDEPSRSSNMAKVTVHGSIAYCAQEAWLSKGTIREAVVFGREYDEAKYLRAIRAAGLDGDIIAGDSSSSTDSTSAAAAKQRGLLTHETDCGEGGSNLSGGQRARVALARALYHESAGVYVLDDPLSALDASVGSMVFERVTNKARENKVATVFVTNDPNLPRRCDRVILMGSSEPNSSPRIVDVGTYDELISRGHDLSTIVHHHDHDVEGGEIIDGEENVKIVDKVSGGDPIIQHQQLTLLSTANDTVVSDCHADPDWEHETEFLAEHVVPPLAVGPNVDDSISLSSKQKQLLSTDDSMATGAVPRSTYVTYFKSVKSPLLIAAALLSYLVSNGSQFFQQLIVARWTDVGKGGSIATAVSAKYLNQLVIAAGMVSISMYCRSYLTMRVGVRASKTLHERMLKSVFGAPLSFFSATPSGQLLNRFGKELEVVDRSLPDGLASVLFCFLQIFFSTFALAGAVTPLMVLPLCFVGLFYVKIMGRFRPAARDLKRVESKSRSPIYTHFREALRGAETIRSVPTGRSSWSSKHRSLADENISVFYSVKALDRWLSVRLESLGNLVVFTAAVASVLLTRAGKLKSGSAGWGLTQALSITGLLTWAVRVLTDLETQFMSVMRVAELTALETTDSGDVKTEDEVNPQSISKFYNDGEVSHVPYTPQSEADLLKSGWPWRGEVQFDNVSMRYNPTSPLVLKNVSINVPAGTTLGVVGRTGSGKSSLLLTLFRLVEVEGLGSITIDGIDIKSLSLKALRDSLSIIPQSPTLFAGTLFYNLDASGKASAEDAWNALQAASPELARQFRDSEAGLNTMISEGGNNLSLGQRQLICLARALLKRSKILVLDEATSSVDTRTDAQVQDTIRKEFVQKGVSVITVAHRLDTVLGYDQILVLDAGMPVEIGAPSDLLKTPGGYLRRLFDADRQNRQKGKHARLRVAS